MTISFLTLPRELRDKIYEFCLLHEEPICPCDGYYDKELTSGLILTNKTINREASMVLYRNCFDFTKITHEGVTSFLEKIGRNVDYIQHVYIDFPKFHGLGIGNVAIEDDDSSLLAHIQSNCINLKTLTASRRSAVLIDLQLSGLVNPAIVTEALALVDTHFKAISSLQNIIIEARNGSLGDYIRGQLEGKGWTIVINDSAYDWNSDESVEYELDPSNVII
jgi:hypothetical protein